MKALNVAVRDTPVGLVACLTPCEWSAFAGIGVRQGEPPYGDIDLGDVLGVVTKCERCDGTGAHDDNGWRGDCPYWLAGCNANNGTTTCSYGCVDEPECMTCEPSEGWGYDPGPTCWGCDGVGDAPPRFVKVLDVWPIVGNYGESVDMCQRNVSHIWIDGSDVIAVQMTGLGADETPIDLPDAEPGGVALHVEWTDCPTCEGLDAIPADHWDGPDEPPCGWLPCPTCQTPPSVEGDAPIVEVQP